MPKTVEEIFAAAPDVMRRWNASSNAIGASLDPALKELVGVRVSQINGCANCLNMHTQWARERGESEKRLYLLSAWEEADCYSERERAALAWAEALTRLSQGHTHRRAREALEAQFDAQEQVKLTMAVIDINGWNRLAVGFGLFVDPAAAKASVSAAA